MIRRLEIQNFKALRDVKLDLTPIHVLIGPNDTGKTSILEGVAALCRSVDHNLADSFIGSWRGTDLVWHHGPGAVVGFKVHVANEQSSFTYTLRCSFSGSDRVEVVYETFDAPGTRMEHWGSGSGDLSNTPSGAMNPNQSMICYLCQGAVEGAGSSSDSSPMRVFTALAGVHYYRWNPTSLALPVAPDSTRKFRMEPSGFGLALCLDEILGYDRDKFIALENQFKSLFPDIKSIKLLQEPAWSAPVDQPDLIPRLQSAQGKGIHFELKSSGKLIPASQMSDGMLQILAYLTILYLPQPPRVLVVEEPENGIHPKRLKEVMTILRELVKEQSHSQVILTTHSPYIVDLFEPNEVSLCCKAEDGSVSVHPLSESETVREQLDVFMLGEIWTAEGDEALAAGRAKDAEPA